MSDPVRTASWWTTLTRGALTRSPWMLRSTHATEVRALARAAEELCRAVERATAASFLATRRWRALAERYRRERDDANLEIERLRATIASLVVDSETGPR